MSRILHADCEFLLVIAFKKLSALEQYLLDQRLVDRVPDEVKHPGIMARLLERARKLKPLRSGVVAP